MKEIAVIAPGFERKAGIAAYQAEATGSFCRFFTRTTPAAGQSNDYYTEHTHTDEKLFYHKVILV